MPLLQILNFDNYRVGLWKINESIRELSNQSLQKIPACIHHPTKQKEWYASRVLIEMLCKKNGIIFNGITYDKHKKPVLTGLNTPSMYPLSITHSYPLVGVIISKKYPCGIDLEYPHKKFLFLKEKFLSQKENYESLNDLCKVWVCKETVYKLYSEFHPSLKKNITIKKRMGDNYLGILKKGSVHLQISISLMNVQSYWLGWAIKED